MKKRAKPSIILSVLWRPLVVTSVLFVCGFIWGEGLINFIENNVWILNGMYLYIIYSVMGLIVFKSKRQQQASYFKIFALWYRAENWEWGNRVSEG